MSATYPEIEVNEGVQPHPNRRMTEEEFLEWCQEKTRAEWVDGEVIVMSPDNVVHSRLVRFLMTILSEHLEFHDLGEVLGPEFMVRLTPRQRRMPDIIFIAKHQYPLLRHTYFDGAPDMAMEVVSPDSRDRDWKSKRREYEKAGVREYWIIDPDQKRVEAYGLSGDKYHRLAEQDGVIRSAVVRGFFLKTEWLWAEPLPKVATVLRELGLVR